PSVLRGDLRKLAEVPCAPRRRRVGEQGDARLDQPHALDLEHEPPAMRPGEEEVEAGAAAPPLGALQPPAVQLRQRAGLERSSGQAVRQRRVQRDPTSARGALGEERGPRRPPRPVGGRTHPDPAAGHEDRLEPAPLTDMRLDHVARRLEAPTNHEAVGPVDEPRRLQRAGDRRRYRRHDRPYPGARRTARSGRRCAGTRTRDGGLKRPPVYRLTGAARLAPWPEPPWPRPAPRPGLETAPHVEAAMAYRAQASGDRLTIEEFERLPGEECRRELVRGIVVREPPAGFDHGRRASRIDHHLRRYVEEHGLGEVCGVETGFILSTDPPTVRAPDAAFVAA